LTTLDHVEVGIFHHQLNVAQPNALGLQAVAHGVIAVAAMMLDAADAPCFGGNRDPAVFEQAVRRARCVFPRSTPLPWDM
jgi:hypothetical protein